MAGYGQEYIDFIWSETFLLVTNFSTNLVYPFTLRVTGIEIYKDINSSRN